MVRRTSIVNAIGRLTVVLSLGRLVVDVNKRASEVHREREPKGAPVPAVRPRPSRIPQIATATLSVTRPKRFEGREFRAAARPRSRPPGGQLGDRRKGKSAMGDRKKKKCENSEEGGVLRPTERTE